MKQISQIKRVLAKKLQIIVSSLELRIKLNLQVIESLDKLSATCAQIVSPTKEQVTSVRVRIAKTEDVIRECHQAIQKLQLLEEALPWVDCSAALRLYQGYSELSLSEFKNILSYELDQLN